MRWEIKSSRIRSSLAVLGTLDTALFQARRCWTENHDRIAVLLQPADVRLLHVNLSGRVIAKTLLTGDEIIRLMRRHRITIAELASHMGITQRRIREVRERGLDNPYSLRDWVQAITGEDLGPLPEMERIRGSVMNCQSGTCNDPLFPGTFAYKYLNEVFCSLECCRRKRGWDIE